MDSSSSDMVEVGDGTTRDLNIALVSVSFTDNLDRFVPTPSAVDSCQEYAGNPPRALCAETNVEGRYTNGHDASDCPSSSGADGTRFIAVEQSPTLRDDDDSDGWYWGDVRDALIATWPECNMNNGSTDCTLGPQQTQYSGLSCSSTLSANETFYNYPDNEFDLPLSDYKLFWQVDNGQLNPMADSNESFLNTLINFTCEAALHPRQGVWSGTIYSVLHIAVAARHPGHIAKVQLGRWPRGSCLSQ